jgi:hypothetical protein
MKIRHRRPFHELIFASIETAPDRSHISLEYLCPFPAEKYCTRRNKPCPAQTTTAQLGDVMEAENWR